MASRIIELQAARAALAEQANVALDGAQALAKVEDRNLSDTEIEAQDNFDQRLAAIETDIKIEERRNDRERMFVSEPAAAAPVAHVTTNLRSDNDPKRGFNSHRDFFASVIENSGHHDRADVGDTRLASLAVMDKSDRAAGGELAFMLPSGFGPKAAAGSDEQGVYDDTYGGFSVGKTRAPGMLQVGFEGDPTAGLTQNIPMASPTVEIMARTDKDHTSSVSGGFTVARRAETVAASSSRMQMEMVTLKAASLFGLAYATEELLQDSAISFAALIDSGFRTQFGAHILNEKLRGLGGDQYNGVLSADCAVSVAKESGQAADTILAANATKMAARSWGFDSAVWLANHDCRPQLYGLNIPMGTASGVPVYQPSREVGFPDMLLGRPVIYSEYMNTVGDLGDFALVNWSQYLEGTYQPIQSAESIHVRFVNHERTFKMWTRNAGAPWWRTPLTPNKSADTMSPIITLAARA